MTDAELNEKLEQLEAELDTRTEAKANVPTRQNFEGVPSQSSTVLESL
jgi:hypothetical protein